MITHKQADVTVSVYSNNEMREFVDSVVSTAVKTATHNFGEVDQAVIFGMLAVEFMNMQMVQHRLNISRLGAKVYESR